MTSPPAQRRPPRPDQSMSLLSDVFANSLDPAYAEAAARRGGERPDRTQWRMLAVLLAVGLVVGIAVHQTRARAPEAARARIQLVQDVQRANAETQKLQDQLNALRAQLSGDRGRLLAATDAGLLLSRQVQALERAVGTTPLTGGGLRVRLNDAPAPQDPLGGSDTSQPNRILDRDIQDVVNALWAAGARGVAVNGVRITAQTAIRTAGEAILVDFKPLSPPYDVVAVADDPVALATAFGSSPTADRFRSYRSAYGLGFDYSRVRRVTLPAAASGVLLHLASPVPRSQP